MADGRRRAGRPRSQNRGRNRYQCRWFRRGRQAQYRTCLYRSRDPGRCRCHRLRGLPHPPRCCAYFPNGQPAGRPRHVGPAGHSRAEFSGRGSGWLGRATTGGSEVACLRTAIALPARSARCADAVDALNLGKIAISPYVSLTYLHRRRQGATDGGGFPVYWDSLASTTTQARVATGGGGGGEGRGRGREVHAERHL